MQHPSKDFRDARGLRDSRASERPVIGAISGGRACVALRAAANAQDLPGLGQVGTVVARAARLAALRHRAYLPRADGGHSQPAGLPKPEEVDRRALFADLFADLGCDEGVLIPPGGPRQGFVWRLHPAPGAAVAPHDIDRR